MKSHTEYLTFETRKRKEMVHITEQVEAIVQRSGVQDGLCFVSPMHITAAVYVNDLESGLIEDIGKWLEQLAPERPDYKHHQTGEDNGDAHLKSLLLHHETTLPVTGGRLDLGPWQRVFYAEFDGQRKKRLIVKVLESEENPLFESLVEFEDPSRRTRSAHRLSPFLLIIVRDLAPLAVTAGR